MYYVHAKGCPLVEILNVSLANENTGDTGSKCE